MGLDGLVEIAQGGARLDVSSPGVRVDPDILHAREIDDKAAVANRMSANVVPAAANGDFKIVLLCKGNCRGHVSSLGAADDYCGSLVNHGVPHAASVIITGIVRGDYRSLDLVS